MPDDLSQFDEDFDVAEHLVSGAARVFSRADRETLLTWRLLMISRYGHESARKCVRELVLDKPCRFFRSLLDRMMEARRLRPDTDTASVGRVIAALFFDYSFRSNLKAGWVEERRSEFELLKRDLEFVARGIEIRTKEKEGEAGL